MCISAILAAGSLLMSAVGTASSIGAANANRDAEIYKAQLQQQQANEQRQIVEIQAFQQESARNNEFERARSAALAAIGASGLGEHISFFKAIDPEAQSQFLQDVRSIRLNMTQQRKTLADQVQVAEYSKTIARSNASASKIGALANFAQTAMGAYSFYNANRTPGG